MGTVAGLKDNIRIIIEVCSQFQTLFIAVKILGQRISYLQLCCRRKNNIYWMSEGIGMIIADKGIQSFIFRWVVVPDDKILSITVLGGYFVLTKSSVNIVYPLRYHCRIFCRKVIFGCVCVISSTESFWIFCLESKSVVWM